ncbi:hypothetical protein, partial [Sphingobium indicum]
KKISELDTVPSVDGTETFPVLKSGYNYKMTVSQIVAWISNATSSVAGFMSASDKSKLDSVQTGATANATNAELRNRATHTGTQPAATITGLADVATTGDYDDLSNQPSFATVATTGAYSDLTGRPTLATVATSGSYNDLSNRPIDANYERLPTVAFQSATGTTAGTAALVTKAVFHIGSSDASNKGIILPTSMAIGTVFNIFNGTGNAINVYPPTGGQINYAGTDVPFALSAYAPLRLVLIDPSGGVYQQL